jgi:hypothetical protein
LKDYEWIQPLELSPEPREDEPADDNR